MKPPPPVKIIGTIPAILYAVGAIISFTLAYAFTPCEFLILAFFACLIPLARLGTRKQAYYYGLTIGLFIYTPHLLFFWATFKWASIALWYILPFWLGLYLMLSRACLFRFGPFLWACLTPFLWTGLEFIRSELYYLRFSWLNAGYVFSDSSALRFLSSYGVYGIGFLCGALASVAALARFRGGPTRVAYRILSVILIGGILANKSATAPFAGDGNLRVTGVQLEVAGAPTVLSTLNTAAAQFPDTDIFVLSEYTFFGPPPNAITNWCRQHRKFLVVGAEDPAPDHKFYNTAFVVDTNGAIVFRQVKCVPVQFMADGLPATNQSLWNSPWGRIGLGICYDASYRRVTDELIRQGAQALIFPTMDSTDWGAAQHTLHARVAPMRAAEYRVPVFRVCSSGISEFVDDTGQVVASALFPGQGAILSAALPLPEHGRLPPDRWLAWLCVAVLVAVVFALCLAGFRQRNRFRAVNPKTVLTSHSLSSTGLWRRGPGRGGNLLARGLMYRRHLFSLKSAPAASLPNKLEEVRQLSDLDASTLNSSFKPLTNP